MTESSVVRLRRLHVTVAASLLAAVVTLPLVRYHADGPLDVIVLVVAIVLASIAVLIAIPERWVGRGGDDVPNMNGPTSSCSSPASARSWSHRARAHPHDGEGSRSVPPARAAGTDPRRLRLPGRARRLCSSQESEHSTRKRRVRAVAMTLGVLTVVTMVASLIWYAGRLNEDQGVQPGSPPALIVVLLVLVGAALVALPLATYGNTSAGIAAGGLGGALVATLAWLLALAFSVGVGLQTAQWLGHAVTSTHLAETDAGPDAALIVPPAYIWAGAAAAVVAVIAVALGIFVWFVLLRRRAAAGDAAISTDYVQLAGDDPDRRHRRQALPMVARWRASPTRRGWS